MTRLAFVLGATGGVGGETARALARHGWQVRGLTRTPRADGEGIAWVTGDAMDRQAVRAAAEGAAVIVHAVNPPGYRDWDKLVLPMLEASLAAAEATGARFAMPGTIYNFDPVAVHVIRPDSPQHPRTAKGRIRAEMEARIAASPARCLILRPGDFFGPRPGNNWLSNGMIKPGKPVRTISTPATPGVGHAWAYLPDVGEAFARLIDKEAELPAKAVYGFAGHWDADGTLITDAIRRAAGDPAIKVSPLPWPILRVIGLVNETMREVTATRQFWQHPLAIDNTALEEAIGPEPRTPLDEAMTATLAGLGCLAAPTGK